ncbi:hypothetical protein KH5H1_26570 [Corallococcus caeni]|uniref:glycosyltransferase family 87 protein n=1 Tax=Corallococcus caeni TaxID=3082388 RepID=UPI0029579583|nr:hypothetical protein KH5H1_26570 [Corallococcus sp. KH5-1]
MHLEKNVRPHQWLLLALASLIHLLPPLLYLAFNLLPKRMLAAGGDFGAYYYALKVALDGGNPYDVEQLRQLSSLQLPPFVYPPPFLLTMSWSMALPMKTGYFAMFVLNELLLVGILLLMRRHLGLDWKLATLLVATYFPLWDNLLWGQINLVVLLPTLGAMVLAERRPRAAGALVGVAAVIKVIPGLLLLYWFVRRQWRPVVAAIAIVVGLSVMVLPLVGLDIQLAYYTQILLGHAQGNLKELGLRVPIASEYNHSLVGVLSHAWPGADIYHPARAVQFGALSFIAALLVRWALWVRNACPPSAALAVLLGIASIASTYAWEHHLLLMMPAVVIAARDGGPRWHFGVLYACMVFPLGLLLALAGMLGVAAYVPVLAPWISLCKLLGILGLCALCLRAQALAEVPRPAMLGGSVDA